MRLRTTPLRKLLTKIDCPVEAQATILIQVDIERLEISWCVDQTDLTGLHEVIRDEEMLLVRRHLDIVRADGWLILIWVIQTLDVVQIADVEGCDVVCCG